MDSTVSDDFETHKNTKTTLKAVTPLDAQMEPINQPKMRTKSFKKLVHKLNCINHRLSTSIEDAIKETHSNKSVPPDDSYNKSTSSGACCEKCDRESASTEGEYEQIRYNNLYDTVGNVKIPNEAENEFDTSQNATYSNNPDSHENATHDVFEKPTAINTAKDIVNSTEGEYEQVRYNSLYDTVGNIKVPNEAENELDTRQNVIYPNEPDSHENATYDIFDKLPDIVNSSEGEYEKVRYNSLYGTMGNIKVPNEAQTESDTSQNVKPDLHENVTYDVLKKPSAINSQHKAKDVVKPAVPAKPLHLCKALLKDPTNRKKVDIAISYNRLEELSRKSEVTSKDIQETLCIVKELENLFHDKVNIILSKFKEN